ncbi:MAG: MoxR family ATPase [Candidatus Anstonellales archaeon]
MIQTKQTQNIKSSPKLSKQRYALSDLQSITEMLGFYGLSNLDDILLSALAQESPVLLIGTPGTAKTKLVLTFFDILNLNSAHYNAAMLSIDELIGYPIKLPNGKISYQPLPSSCWDKQAIFIDEISRCKPEIQNKFFSLIYEKKIYGIPLTNLVYRWAAMNPPKLDNIDIPESFVTEGTYPLDAALADRFSYIIKFPNFYELKEEDRKKIIAINEENTNNNLSSLIKSTIKNIKESYRFVKAEYLETFNKYLYLLAVKMAEIDLHLSSRRIVIIKENIMWNLTVNYIKSPNRKPDLYKVLYVTTLNSLPHSAYKEFDEEKLKLAISYAIKISGIKFDFKNIIYQEQSPIERIILCVEGLKSNQIDLQLLNEVLDSALHTADPLEIACFVTVGFKYLSQISGLTANIADKLCFEFMKYTSSVKIRIENEDDEESFELESCFKSFERYFCEYNIENMINSFINDKVAVEKNIKDAIMCSFLNYLCETQPEFLSEDKVEELLNRYISTFMRYLDRLENIFKQN